MTEFMTIGVLAKRAGVNTSAIRFYDAQGLIQSQRNQGAQRLFHKDMLRRVAFIGVAQRLGLSLADINQALAGLPDNRTPTPADWAKLSRAWRPLLQERIDMLIKMRDQLDSCIGCGCLSLSKCKLYNPLDQASKLGSGPRYLLGDSPPDEKN
jgi:MerR family transcriptional regulator, redox-sensitive transcriptional activator SoxR